MEDKMEDMLKMPDDNENLDTINKNLSLKK